MTAETDAPDTTGPGPDEEPPIADLIQLLAGKWAAYALYAAADLGVADVLADGARNPDQVADAVGIRPDGARRLLRALDAVDILDARDDGTFVLAPAGEHLRSDAEVTLRGLARLHGQPWHNRVWEGFEDQLRTGECAMETELGKRWTEFLAERPAAERMFGESTASMTTFTAPAILDAVDLAGLERIVDVGGGWGTLIAEVLRDNPDAEGVLLEIPSVAEDAREHLADVDVGDRIEVVGGDYHEAVPEGDGYLLSHILHNVQDDDAVQLLDRIRQTMAPGGRVVVVDFVLDQRSPMPAIFDLELWVINGGGNRTADEFARLFEKAGFETPEVRELPGPASVLVAEAAGSA